MSAPRSIPSASQPSTPGTGEDAGLHIRRARTDDLDAVLALFLAAGIDDRTAAVRAAESFRRIEAMGAGVWVAESAGRMVGTLTCFVLPLLAHEGAPAALVEDVVVHPAMQGSGVGRALMHHAMDLARTQGCYKLALSSNARRTAAHAFYEHLGFERHGFSFVVTLDTASPA